MKYLLLGAFSSGFLALRLLGAVRHLGLDASCATSPRRLRRRDLWDPLVFLALGTTAVGLLFKISAVPFHMWAPDAYEGAPTTITAYLSVGSKAASFAFLLRIFLGPLAASREVWEPLLAAIAIATMTVGNLAAISQTNVKRLLAYSSISHAGLHPAGPDRRKRDRHQGRGGLRSGVHVHEPGRVHGAGGAAAQRDHRRRYRRPGRPDAQESRPRAADADLPAVAGGHSAHRGVPGQVLHFPFADRDRPLRAGGGGDAVRGGGDLLLLPPGPQHVRQRGSPNRCRSPRVSGCAWRWA